MFLLNKLTRLCWVLTMIKKYNQSILLRHTWDKQIPNIEDRKNETYYYNKIIQKCLT